MIRTAVLDPKGQRPFPSALLAGGVEVPETGPAMPAFGDTPSHAESAQAFDAAGARQVIRRAIYPK